MKSYHGGHRNFKEEALLATGDGEDSERGDGGRFSVTDMFWYAVMRGHLVQLRLQPGIIH